MNLNPFTIDTSYQEIAWGHLDDKKTYSFELILPLKAIGVAYRSTDNGYLPVCAESLQTIKKGEWDWLIKGSLCIINFPVATLERAWMSVSPVLRRQITEDNNIQIKFKKKSKQAIIFESVERVQPTEEHLKFANRIYSKESPLGYQVNNVEEI